MCKEKPNTPAPNPTAVLETKFGNITIELYPRQAPNTVGCFISLARQGLFNNRKIRRIVPGFVLQPSYNSFEDERCDIHLNGEYQSNGIVNNVPFKQGTVAMGGSGNIASGSCFFITLSDEAGQKLAGNYAAFGMVTDGWDVVEQIVNLPLKAIPNDIGVEINEPVEPVFIERLTVETWGIDYDFEALEIQPCEPPADML